MFKFPKILPLLTFILIITISISCSKKVINTQTKNSKDSTVVVSKADLKKEKNSENDDYYQKNRLRYNDYVYVNNIKTILLHKEGSELSMPILELNSDDKLKISFDGFDNDVKYYKYTIIHCDAYWKPSDLQQSEYISGFTEDYIEEYEFSLNTMQSFIHYELIFPTENLKLFKSGNYLLKVYLGESDNVYFTKRFMIFESKVTVDAKINRTNDVAERNYNQKINFSIKKGAYNIVDPSTNLKVIITQNKRWDNAIKGLQPLMVKDEILDYNFYDSKNVFSGGNEFRNFDFRSLKYTINNVWKISYDSSFNQVYLKSDINHHYDIYYSEQDINGKRLIKTYDGNNDATESDYAFVHFFLPYKTPLVYGNLYLMGTLTDWQFNKQGLLKYNYQKHGYETSIYLKQGYYNYQYVFLENGKSIGDESFIEGKHFETENDYTIYVYYREPGTLYDKLIAVKLVNTVKSN